LSNDSKNQAASIKVGISNYVGSAALAVLAGAAALYTYISQTFEPPTCFDIVMVIAVILLVAAIVFGGRGADKSANAVAAGTWSTNSAGESFNLQALLTLVGLVLVLIAAAIGANSQRREGAVEERVTRLERQVHRLETQPERRASNVAP
jgi:hypothetical protein